MPPSTPSMLVRTEAAALSALADRLDGAMAAPFEQAVALLLRCVQGRVVVTGMGKSGIIAQKIAATLSSTGSPALFLHPAEAVHGDIGMLAPGDVVVALSASGETEELLRLLATIKRVGDALITFCCNLESTLARASDVALDCSVAGEACGLGLAPTASTTTMLALGDALAIAVSLRKGFRVEDFARLHPGGRLGKQLASVRALMHTGERIPSVSLRTPMSEVLDEMTRKGLGMCVVLDASGNVAGVVSDGDLRRLLVGHGGDALALRAEDVMHRAPHMIGADELAASALAVMEQHRITSLVVQEADGSLAGVVHLHALWGLGLV
ncbi:SIS domain-containing protein [Acidipila sp. EB88]|uniref:KpsF/GutQ family sugar-phosphate isomerase n=1 Tax=Acidipila sp. EB88 TaxID=2305226 RepID=UPI001F244816|nr:KpsF/GutQ family sugar-phosphate isomerase [Acidipila sp. EB88]